MGKKAFLGMMVIIILIGVNGCMAGKKEPSIAEQVEKYMEDKYNEEFKFLGGGTESWNAPYEEIYVSSEKFPDEEILVIRGKDDGEMEDNYVSFLMKSKVEEAMSEIVSEIYPDSKVFYQTTGSVQGKATPEMGVDEYIKYSGEYLSLSITICIDDPEYESNKDEKLEQLRLKFQEKQYMPKFRIFYMVEGKLELLNGDNWRESLSRAPESESWTLMGIFYMDESFQIYDYEWREVK